jgi:hypothetical protein
MNRLDHIFVICSPEYEPGRYPMMKHLVDSFHLPSSQISFMCPTYKTTITNSIMSRYVKSDSVHTVLGRPSGMKKSEISLFLNFKAILENIRSQYSEGMFLTFESDVIKLERTFLDFEPFLDAARDSINKWDIIDVGSITGVSGRQNNSDFVDSEKHMQLNGSKTFRISRMRQTRCTDSLLWSYSGVVKFLNYLEANPFYEYPLDYYMDDFFHNSDIRFYWSNLSFFMQTSNLGICASTIK